jgi:transcriptional regulator with XRE-family HTH domain
MISDLFNKYKNGRTNYALSKETGISISTLNRIFDGEQDPSIRHFAKLCKALEIPTAEITKLAKELTKDLE